MTIQTERLEAVMKDPLVGKVEIGRMTSAWQTQCGEPTLKVAYSGDVILELTSKKLTMRASKRMTKVRFYDIVSKTVATAGLGTIEIVTRGKRLIGTLNDITHIGAIDGALVIPITKP